MEVTALRIFYGLMTRPEAPEQKPLLVGRSVIVRDVKICQNGMVTVTV